MQPFPVLTSAAPLTREPAAAASLVPEASHTVDGAFVDLWKSAVPPAAALPESTGGDLPASGKPLPAPSSGDELPRDVAIALPVDLAPSWPGAEASKLAPPGLMPEAAPATPDPADAAAGAVNLPVRVHVPPESLSADGTSPALPGAGSSPGVDAPDSLPAAMPTMARELRRRGSEVDGRAGDPDAGVRPHGSAATADERVAAHSAAAARDARTTSQAGRLLGVGNDGQPPPGTLKATAAEPAPALIPGELPRVSSDDGTLPPRSLQPAAAWQQGYVITDYAVDAGPRIATEIPAPIPKMFASMPPQTPLPPAAQVIDVAVQQPGWDNAVADRVTLMANGRLQNAELRLTPAELGPLRIRMEIDDGVANVSFQSQHPVTREALEQAMPRLRELLAENGFSLGHADVGDDADRHESREARAHVRASDNDVGDEPGAGETAMANGPARPAIGLVDTFA